MTTAQARYDLIEMPASTITTKIAKTDGDTGVNVVAPKRAAPRFLTSFTTQLVAILVLTYTGLWFFYPWKPLAELDIPPWMVKFAGKTAVTLRDTHAQVVTLGTSLIGAPSARLKRPRLYEQLLCQASHHSISNDTLCAPGAVMSDEAFLVHQLFVHGKHPKLIVLSYSIRDFCDNEVGDRLTATPTKRVVNFVNKRDCFLPISLNAVDLNNWWTNHTVFADLLRRHWLHETAAFASKTTGHPLTLWVGAQMGRNKASSMQKTDVSATPVPKQQPLEAAAGADDGSGQKPNPELLALDLKIYRERYLPFNDKRVATQMGYLRDLLSECREHKTSVILVGMPLSPANLAILPTGLYQSLAQSVHKQATACGADAIDLNVDKDLKMTQADFLDSVHVSTSGAKKFAPAFGQVVAESPVFKKIFD